MQDEVALTGPPVTSIDDLPGRLAAIEAALPSADGVACFTRMYQLVTEAVRQQMMARTFADPAWLGMLDIVFGNLYLDALRAAVQAPDQMPRAWAALIEVRSDARVTPLQFALAGMNAHINRDLPVAVVASCQQLSTSPDTGSHHGDFVSVNAILASVEPGIRQSFSSAVLLEADRALPGLQDTVANFDMAKARETAWSNAETLWVLHQISPARAATFLNALDHLVGFAGRGLLVPLHPTVR